MAPGPCVACHAAAGWLRRGRSSYYYAWRASPPARQRRSAVDATLTRIHISVQGRPGHGLTQNRSPTSTRPPRRGGRGGRRKRVARLMRAADTHRLPATAPGAHTAPDQASVRYPDLLTRDFTAPVSKRRHSGDIPPNCVGAAPFLPAPGRRDGPVSGYRHRLRPAGAWSLRRRVTTCARPLYHRGDPAGHVHLREPERRRLPLATTDRSTPARHSPPSARSSGCLSP